MRGDPEDGGQLLSRNWAALLLIAACWLAVAADVDAPAADHDVPPPTVKRPNDPLFRLQWHLPAIQVPSAWAISRGAGATVAVLDTGVAYRNRGRHRQAPDLAGARFVAGWDFVDDDAYPDDVPPPDGRRSHGTLMAAIIAQTAGNGIGGVGVAPAAAIMPIRVLRPDLTGSGHDIARGLRFAVDHGADIVNLSIAGALRQPRVLTEALAYAEAKGVVVVAAAGNNGHPPVGWPAADQKVLAVGAVDRDLQRAPYSNYGAALDLVAPGGAGDRGDAGYGPADGVLAQTLKGGRSSFCFCTTASSSAAAAQVSGVAALLVGSGRARGPAQIRAALLSGARDLGPRGPDPEYGAGLVQASRALARAGAASAAVSRGSRPPDTSPASGCDVCPPLSTATGLAVSAGLVLAGGLVLATRSRRRRA